MSRSVYLLPLLGAQLVPCPRQWDELLPQLAGRYCASCQHLVHDFSPAAALPAALAAARAASPSGQVCGRFGAAQVAQPRLRRFLVALVLVVGLGMSARAALAQRQPQHSTINEKQAKPASTQIAAGRTGATSQNAQDKYHAEQMPTFRGLGYQGIVAYVQKQVTWPKGAGLVCANGRVFVRFTVDTDGRLREVRVVKGLHPLLDAEAIRAVQALRQLQPGREHGKPVAVTLTVPVCFTCS